MSGGRLAGRSVVVTGARTGFGAVLARQAAREGARVVVHHRSSAAVAEETAAAVRELGSEAMLVQADIASWEGREVTEEAIDHVLAVDVKGTMLMTHECSRMLDAGRGAIVDVGSTVIARGSPRAPQ